MKLKGMECFHFSICYVWPLKAGCLSIWGPLCTYTYVLMTKVASLKKRKKQHSQAKHLYVCAFENREYERHLSGISALQLAFGRVKKIFQHEVEDTEPAVWLQLQVFPRAEEDRLFWKTDCVYSRELIVPIKFASHALITAKENGTIWFLNTHVYENPVITEEHF